MSTVDSRTLSEAASKALIAEHGIATVDERLAATPAEAAAVAHEVGFPVVAKLSGDRITHKADRGLVRLGLTDADAVSTACTELLEASEPEDGDVGLLVSRQLAGARELMAGLYDDVQFGMTVMLGVGGVLAEALADVAVRLVPIERVDAQEMISDLRTQSLLGPFRGEPPVDRTRLADVLLGLDEVARSTPGIVSVDVNPLIVSDGAPIAVDALVEVRS